MRKEAFEDIAIELTRFAVMEAGMKGYTHEMIAFKVGVSTSSVDKYSSGERIPSLSGFLALTVGLKLKETVKRLAGLVGLKSVEVTDDSLPTTLGKVMKEFGEAIAEITRALEDGEVDEEERARCLKEIDEAIDELLKFKNQLEVK